MFSYRHYYWRMYCSVQASLASVGCAGCLDQSGLSIQSGQQIANAPYCFRCIVLDAFKELFALVNSWLVARLHTIYQYTGILPFLP